MFKQWQFRQEMAYAASQYEGIVHMVGTSQWQRPETVSHSEFSQKAERDEAVLIAHA